MSEMKRMLEAVQQNTLVPLASLYPHARNYRSHPPEQIKMLKASLERFGLVRSIVCQPNSDGSYTIIAGHGVVEAAQALVESDSRNYERFGHLRVDVIPASWDKSACEAYLVADNNINQHASDDEELLASLLDEQKSAGFDLASIGTDEEALRQMLNALTPASSDEWSDALGDLPDGEKSPFQQMTFTLSNEQADLVKEALDLALEDKDNFEDMGNQNSNGNALAYTVKFFLEMGRGESDE